MMELTQKDLPDPVCPAIRRWGILAISPTRGLPSTSRPRARRSRVLASRNWGDSIISRSPTVAIPELGISIPTTGRPGTGSSMRRVWAARTSCRSASKDLIFFTEMPSAGLSRNCVTRGPMRASLTVTGTLKAPRVRSIRRAFSATSASLICSAVVEERMAVEGSSQVTSGPGGGAEGGRLGGQGAGGGRRG